MPYRSDSVVSVQRVISVGVDSGRCTLSDVHSVHHVPDNHQVSGDGARELQVSCGRQAGGAVRNGRLMGTTEGKYAPPVRFLPK